jgi:hypothetical protein
MHLCGNTSESTHIRRSPQKLAEIRLISQLANLIPMMHHVYGYSFSRASTVMRHQPLRYSGGVMDSSRAG